MSATSESASRSDPLGRLRYEAGAAGAPIEWDGAATVESTLAGLVLASATDPGTRGEAAFALEAVFEGFLCHQGGARLFPSVDEDLALLTGDLLYAIGLRAVSVGGDTASVRVLAELIGTAAGLASEGRKDALVALWPAQAVVLGDPSGGGWGALVATVGKGGDADGSALAAAARGRALAAGADGAFDRATDALQSALESVVLTR